MKLSNFQINIIIFLTLTVVVFLLHFIVLNGALGIGFSPDDWELYLRYKALGDSPLTKIGQVWAERGLYTTYQIYYMGLLDFLVGYNHRLFQTLNLTFKIIATLSLYPLILVIFQKRALAILSVIFFTLSHSSVGALEYPVKGSDYISIFFMNIFLIIYFLILKEKLGLKYLILAFILLILAVMFSPIRMFPLLFILPLIELYFLIKNKNLMSIKKSLLRMLIFYSPFIYLIFHIPSLIIGAPPAGIYHRVLQGDWYILLSPLSGLGYTFITGQYWGKIFGQINTDNFTSYLFFLFANPSVVFGFLTALLTILYVKNKWRFFIGIFITNFLLEILLFFIAYNYRYFPIAHDVNYDPNALYSILLGSYILIVTFIFFFKWWLGKSNDKLFLASCIGLAFLVIFTFSTWAFAPDGTQFSATSYYLVVACIGTSIFLAALVISIYNRLSNLKKSARFPGFIVLLVFIFSFFLMSTRQIYERFKDRTSNGRGSVEQTLMQQKVRNGIKSFDLSKPKLFYFDTTEASLDSFYLSETLLLTLPSWIHFQDGKLMNGCVEVLYNDNKKLSQLIIVRNGQKGFDYRGLCVEIGGKGVYYKDIFYEPENFYAFKLENQRIINIKQEILKSLGL